MSNSERPYEWMTTGQLMSSLLHICQIQEDDYGGGTSTEQTRELVHRFSKLEEVQREAVARTNTDPKAR